MDGPRVRRHRDSRSIDNRCWRERCDRDDHVEEACDCGFSHAAGFAPMYPHVRHLHGEAGVA